jgi:putative ABC transport system permease protein
LIAGRNFSPEFPSDSLHAVIVNEAFVKEAGWKPEDALGKTVGMMNKSLGQPVIVGVIKDYHFVSLREKIKPALYSMNPQFNFGQIWVKIGPGDVPQSLLLIESTFKKLVPYFPYSYQFMDDIKAADYKTEARLRQLTIIASGLFIFISFIGLFGLAILSIEQRTKEIGIRKVLGAAVLRIARLISKDFVSLVFIAFLIAVPCAHLVVNQWLQKFAYHVTISWWLVVIAGLTVIVLSTAIVGIQAVRAALANPVKNLRTE